MSEVLVCAECWHDLRQHSQQCDGPLCSCDKTPDTAPYFRLPPGSTVVGAPRVDLTESDRCATVPDC